MSASPTAPALRLRQVTCPSPKCDCFRLSFDKTLSDRKAMLHDGRSLSSSLLFSARSRFGERQVKAGSNSEKVWRQLPVAVLFRPQREWNCGEFVHFGDRQPVLRHIDSLEVVSAS